MSSRIKGIIDAVSDLAMDYSSRMARAEKGGFFGSDAYRGLRGEYDPEKSGYYQMFTSSPQDAGEYGNNVLKAKLRRGKNLEVEGGGKNFNNIYVGGLPSDVFNNLHPSIRESLTARTDDIAHAARKAGYDSATIKDIYDKADNEIPMKPSSVINVSDADLFSRLGISPDHPLLNGSEKAAKQNVVIPKNYGTSNIDIIFDPSNIRSVNAAFDPAKKDSPNLLAGVTGAGLLGGSMFASEDADAGILSRIKAFHGSPHDFDKFSTENIGTGEGAQAYGHGLYFAEREGTAKAYRDNLKGNIVTRNDGVQKTYGQHITDVENAIKAEHPNLHSDNVNRAAKSVIDDNLTLADIEGMGEFENVYKTGINANKSARESKGSMYEVDIDASPDELLDYDLPLNTQSPKIQKSIDDIMKSMGVESYVRDGGDGAETIYIGTGLGGLNTGSEILNNLSGKRGPLGASQMLKEAGVKGIKYADAQTRFSPKGRTNNYVMFDDKTISIARKYGVAMPVAAAILAGTVTPQDAQASTEPGGKGLLDSIGDTALETMSGVNRAAADGVNFLTSDQINAILNLSGSDKRIPDLYDIPGVESGTKGNYMEPGLLRQIVRQGSEFLSPI